MAKKKAAKKTRKKSKKSIQAVDQIKHADARRTNIPTAEFEAVMHEQDKTPKRVAYDRNRDLDPQLMWRGKDEQNLSDLIVQAPPLYIQEKVHAKVLIDDLLRESKSRAEVEDETPDLFSDFNGIADPAKSTEFYQHDQNWTNRMILGDSLQVMASLAEREGLRGKVQCIYLDPPYGIKFNSNFQWSTTSRDVKDGKADHITREPEQVKAFRDTWRDGIHSYLTYLRDRLTVARDLLTESGSVFVQIGDENVHRVRALMDEVFGEDNAVTEILVKKKGSQKSGLIDPVNDYILWYSKTPRIENRTKFRPLYEPRELDSDTVDEFSRVEHESGKATNLKSYKDATGTKLDFRLYPKRISEEFPGGRLFRPWPITNGGERANQMDPITIEGREILPPRGRCWSHTARSEAGALSGMQRVLVANRLIASKTSLDFKRYLDDFPYKSISNWWDGFGGASNQIYVVQTNERLIERCILMTTDPGDLVLDPTCGSGTTAFVAEQWGRRWITVDTSRVALALTRSRIMGARFPYYVLADSPEGLAKEAEITGKVPSDRPTGHDICHGFVYRRCAHITSGVIANIAEIDVIWEKWQEQLEPLREKLNQAAGAKWEEWEIPRDAEDAWKADAKKLHSRWWEARIARQKEIDASIAAKADFEYLYDKPYADNSRVRVSGPFTVESISPHRILSVDEAGKITEPKAKKIPYDTFTDPEDFVQMVLENLRTAGVQQADKADRIQFHSMNPWPGEYILAEGYYQEGDTERRAGIMIGPEFGTVSRADLAAAAREAAETGFHVLICCAFNYDARSSDLSNVGKIQVLKARMNPDLHMADDLKNTGHGNLFVVFGEPDIAIEDVDDGRIQVRILGIDIFRPQTGQIDSQEPDEIALWFIDTDYNEESFFVRHAYFLGAGDPYNALRSSLKAEIDAEAWSSLNSEVSRPFEKPESGRIAVKVINHLGDEVMKVFRV